MKHGKILVVGAGRVGTTAAFAMILQNIGREIRLVDIDENILNAECMDLRDAKYFSFTEHVHKGTWEDAKDAQIIVICAGEVLRPEINQDDILRANKKIFDNIFSKLTGFSRDCVLVVATSPVDAMTYYAQQLSGLPQNQVFGTGTLLDTQRLRVKFSKKFGVNEKSVHAYVLGEHGDSQFIPWSHATIAGKFMYDYFAEGRETQERLLEEFSVKVRNKSKDILRGKPGTEFGIGACIAAICRNVLYDTKVVMPLCCYVQEYGVCLSVLCTLGEVGIAKYLPLDLTEKEKNQFRICARNVQRMLDILGVKKEEGKVPSGRDVGGLPASRASMKEEGDKTGYGIEGYRGTEFLRPQEEKVSPLAESLPGRTESLTGRGEVGEPEGGVRVIKPEISGLQPGTGLKTEETWVKPEKLGDIPSTTTIPGAEYGLKGVEGGLEQGRKEEKVEQQGGLLGKPFGSTLETKEKEKEWAPTTH